MEVKVFIHNFREAFGVTANLPFVFWYSDIPISEDIEKINGCYLNHSTIYLLLSSLLPRMYFPDLHRGLF